MGIMSSPAWTRKEGKNPKGGLNAKGRASYNKGRTKTGKKRNLKAPSKVVGNKRRKSFCARMKGMKKKLTSAKLQEILTAELINHLELGTVDKLCLIMYTLVILI